MLAVNVRLNGETIKKPVLAVSLPRTSDTVTEPDDGLVSCTPNVAEVETGSVMYQLVAMTLSESTSMTAIVPPPEVASSWRIPRRSQPKQTC